MSIRRATARWRARARQANEARLVRNDVWRHERALEAAVAHDGPVIAGPWMSEVGYEVLYWIPFLRWVQVAYRIAPERLIVLSRGGVASWYADLTTRYAEIFDIITPAEYAEWQQRRAADERSAKQLTRDAMDERLAEAMRRQAGRGARVLHPSVMFGLFAPFWSGQQGTGFIESRTRYRAITGNAGAMPELPSRYVAAKFYAARALPRSDESRRLVGDLVSALSERMPVVVLESGTRLDEHVDYDVESDGGRVIRIGSELEARTNLEVQTHVIAGAQAFVGTCGSLAWLAPMLGVDTTAVLTDGRLLHSHLHLARRVYQRLDGGRFSPTDLGALSRLGLTVRAAADA